MGIIITPEERIRAYFDSEKVNQSSLKELKKGLSSYLDTLAKREREKEEGKAQPEYFIIGSAVDTILTGEEGEYEKQYYVSKLESLPSEAEIKIVDMVFSELYDNDVEIDMELSEYRNMIDIAIKDTGWYNGKPGEKRTLGLIEKCTLYFEDLKASAGKEVISTELDDRIQRIVKSLRENPRTSKYFNRADQEALKNVDFYYQLPMYFDYKGLECKALMDLVVVVKDDNGNIKSIVPIDLKTMSGYTTNFMSNFRTHRYDMQAAWYVLALTKHFNCSEDIIKPFKFIVESTTNIGKPLIFEITPATLAHGRHGAPDGVFKAEDSDRVIYYPETPGYDSLVDLYSHYVETGWDEDVIIDPLSESVTLDWYQGLVK